jgi:hypothetical protein
MKSLQKQIETKLQMTCKQISEVQSRSIATKVKRLEIAKTAPPDVLDGVHTQAVRLMYNLASHLQPLLQDCLDFALDVPECGCAHSRACSDCERYREAQRLAERLAELTCEAADDDGNFPP